MWRQFGPDDTALAALVAHHRVVGLVRNSVDVGRSRGFGNVMVLVLDLWESLRIRPAARRRWQQKPQHRRADPANANLLGVQRQVLKGVDGHQNVTNIRLAGEWARKPG